MSKCYLLFAEGFEECEGLVTLDILRRAGLEAYTVSIQDAHTVVGAHGVPITCDRTLPELLAAPPELVVLPGGMPGTTNLAKSPAVEALVRRCTGSQSRGSTWRAVRRAGRTARARSAQRWRSRSSSCACSPTSRPPRARPRRSSGARDG